jgi:hypothetical protein
MLRSKSDRPESHHSAFLATPVLAAALLAGCASSESRTVFARPEQATDALVEALRAKDEAALRSMLGPDAQAFFASGDAATDEHDMRTFVAAYARRHTLEPVSSGTVRLTVGPERWPMPIPLVREEGGWVFATEAGKREIAARFIGESELGAIEVCLAIAAAQREYAYRDPDANGLADFAEKLVSDPGTKNGLYWSSAAGEAPAPLGRAFIEALRGNGASSSNAPPYHGYRYRILTSQGPNAGGGERDYVVQGKMIGGFAVVAWPARFGTTGLSTFIVNQDDVVYQAYLGPRTESVAAAMVAFDPGPGWTAVSSEDIAAATDAPRSSPPASSIATTRE